MTKHDGLIKKGILWLPKRGLGTRNCNSENVEDSAKRRQKRPKHCPLPLCAQLKKHVRNIFPYHRGNT